MIDKTLATDQCLVVVNLEKYPTGIQEYMEKDIEQRCGKEAWIKIQVFESPVNDTYSVLADYPTYWVKDEDVKKAYRNYWARVYKLL